MSESKSRTESRTDTRGRVKVKGVTIRVPVANDTREILRDGTFRWDNHVWRAVDWPGKMLQREAQGLARIKRVEVRIIRKEMCVLYDGKLLALADLVGETQDFWQEARTARLAANATEMLALVRPYLRHKNTCASRHYKPNGKKCTCGLAQILPEMEYETNG